MAPRDAWHPETHGTQKRPARAKRNRTAAPYWQQGASVDITGDIVVTPPAHGSQHGCGQQGTGWQHCTA